MKRTLLLIALSLLFTSYKAVAQCDFTGSLSSTPSCNNYAPVLLRICSTPPSGASYYLVSPSGMSYTGIESGGMGACPFSVTWNNMPVGSYTLRINSTTCPGWTVNVTSQSSALIGVNASRSPILCYGEQITITGTGGSNYSWTSSAGGSLSGSSITVAPTQNTTYTVTGAKPCGGSGSASLTVDVSPTLNPGTITISGDQIICNNTNVSPFSSSANASGGNGSYQYQWQSRPQGGQTWSNIPNATGATYDHENLAETTEFHRQVTSCVQTLYSNTITVTTQAPVGQVSVPSGGSATICMGSEPIDYDATATNASGGYSWNITAGAGQISSSGVVTWNSSFSGTATVTVTAYGCNGTSTSNSTNVTVKPGVGLVEITSGESTVCHGASSTYGTSGASNAEGDFTWTVTPLDAGEFAPAGHTISWGPSFTGFATITVTAHGCGGSQTSNNLSVEVIPTVGQPTVLSGPTSRCIGSETGTYTTDGASYTSGYIWSITEGSGEVTPSGTLGETGMVSWNPSFSGTATITVRADGCNGPSSPRSTNVIVTPGVGQVSAPSGPLTHCSGDEATNYSATVSNGTITSWSISPEGTGAGAGSISSEGTVTWNPTFQGTAQITVTATGCNGSTSTNHTDVTVTGPLGLVNITNGPSSRCMGGGSDTYTATTQNATFEWTVDPPSPGSISPLGGTMVWAPGFSGTARITITATGCTGATLEDFVDVEVSAPSYISGFSVLPGTEFYGSTAPPLTLSQASSVGAVTYEASTNGGSTWTPVSSTPFEVQHGTRFRAKAVNGVCAPVHSGPITISVYPAPVITIAEEVNYLSYENGLHLSTGNYTSWQWTKAGGQLDDNDGQTLTVDEPGTYSVNVKGSLTADWSLPISVTIYGSAVQSQNLNYITTTIFLKEDQNPDALHTVPPENYTQSTTYYDGLGRPMQTVAMKGSPQGNDVVQPVAYDAFGREPVKYLPYVSTQSDGLYKNDALAAPASEEPDPLQKYRTGKQYTFYQAANSVAHDEYPYAETKFESSPLNRILKQGAPGEAWQPNGDPLSMEDKTLKKEYGTNAEDEVLLFTYDATTALINLSSDVDEKFYFPSQLYANKTYDEHNNEVIEYSDKEGRTVCKKVQYSTEGSAPDVVKLYAATYYIYDDFGNLVVVLPPEGTKKLMELSNQN